MNNNLDKSTENTPEIINKLSAFLDFFQNSDTHLGMALSAIDISEDFFFKWKVSDIEFEELINWNPEFLSKDGKFCFSAREDYYIEFEKKNN